MTMPAFVQYNTRERALSSDLNKEAALGRRGLVEAATAILTGNARQSGCIGQSSFLATPVNGTLKSSITPGLALYFDSSKVYPESGMLWIESAVIREVTHDPGDASPRYDVIEMQAGSEILSTQPRDQFDPLTGTFTVVNMTKEVGSKPVFQVRKGTPSASPAVTPGTPGWIPLSYVLVPAGALTLLSTNVVYCRPILGNRQVNEGGWVISSLANAFANNVTGGGVEAAGGSLAASLASTVEGRFVGHYHKFRLSASATLRIGVMTWDGTGLPAADGAVYFYAIPPPYPAGYDSSMAPREIWTPDVATIYSTNGGFYSSTLQEGCIIVASSTPPSLLHPSGAPAGVGVFAHEFFSDLGNVNSNRPSWVYLGAASFELAGNQLVTQTALGAVISTDRKPGKDFFALLPIGADTLFSVRNEVPGDPVVRMPITMRRATVQIVAAVNNNAALRIEAVDDHASATIPKGGHYYVLSNTGGAQLLCSVNADMVLDTSGRFLVHFAATNGAASARCYVRDYTDAVLRLRMS